MPQQRFKLHSDFSPTGDQPQAIEKLAAGLEANRSQQVLLGVTGSGKTFTVANVIEKTQKPTLVISHNKTLAAQLYQEFREFFPENEVHYFVSYYDYYQPEAYIPQRDLYIEKEADINKEIEKLRHSATHALMTRRDVIVVASVSCIYGLGRPEDYMAESSKFNLPAGKAEIQSSKLEKVKLDLVRLLYQRNDWDFKRGMFRVRGDTVEVFPPYGELVLRLEFLGDDLTGIGWIEPASGRVIEEVAEATLFAASHFVTPEEKLKKAMAMIEAELGKRVPELEAEGKALEAHRLKQRTEYDLELMSEMGFCPGIENYSRYLTGRKEGEAPYTLLDYFDLCCSCGACPRREATTRVPTTEGHRGGGWLCVIDESHMTIPQICGMYNGDRSRKDSLVDYGFRLPSARDNRPLKFDEFLERVPWAICTSATPDSWELSRAQSVVEQLIRPTDILDPEIEIRPIEGQIEDLVREIAARKRRGERTLVTTLTKRMAEDLSDYLADPEKISNLVEKEGRKAPLLSDPQGLALSGGSGGIKACYLHSDVETLKRTDILADLRRGVYDVVVGINLLREGLDLPEVSLVAILDADKEGFLRSETSLIQTMGRAARHIRGRVILYADKVTGSMRRAIEEVSRRRKVQEEYNRKHGVTPKTIEKGIRKRLVEAEDVTRSRAPRAERVGWELLSPDELKGKIFEWETEMKQAADELNFERAAELRDLIREVRRAI